jgi:hypothetical protein
VSSDETIVGDSMENYFMFDKAWIKAGHWSSLSLTAKAVFPVIAVHCGANGIAFPGEETIAKLTGRTAKTVRQGIRDLEEMAFHGFRVSHYKTKQGRRAKSYQISPAPRTKGAAFPFYRSLIDSGAWGKLKPSARAVYIAMRICGFFDFMECTDDDYDGDDAFRDRRCDLCNLHRTGLSYIAGIDRRSFREAEQSLIENRLIEETPEGWEVMLRVEWEKTTGDEFTMGKSSPWGWEKVVHEVGKSSPWSGKKLPGK